MTTTFAQLGVSETICRALERRGITEAFEIQAATIADALAGRDVCGRAPTGSGKTLAFGVPLIATVARAEKRRPRALVLAPTRELADQITTELRSFAGNVRVFAVYGGVGYGPQLKAMRDGVDVLVACPGRLEDLIEKGTVSLDAVDKVVLDEADRMADMGFMPAVRRLLDQTSSKRQTVLFSATLDGDIAKLTRDYQNDPVRHEVGDATPDITSASHVFWNTVSTDRTAHTAAAIDAVWPAIVFTRTRHGADRLAKQLDRQGIKTAAIHGGRNQGQRTRALDAFAKNKVEALIATDVAARGIHVDGVALVVHYDPPADHKDYIHRSGRTARAGEGGVVLSLVQRDQVKDLKKMQRKVGLDEPFVEPAVAAMRELSPSPTRAKAPRPASTDDQGTADGRSSNSRGGNSRSGNSRSGNSRGSNGRNGNGRNNGSSNGAPQGERTARRKRPSHRNTSDSSRSDSNRSDNNNGDNSSGANTGRSSNNGRSRNDGRSSNNAEGARSGNRNENGRSNAGGRGGGPKGRRRAPGERSTSERNGSSGRQERRGSAQGNNSGPKPNNRKARRAHLQPRPTTDRSA